MTKLNILFPKNRLITHDAVKIMPTNLPTPKIDLPPETENAVYQALVRALRRKDGFGLFFVQCSPEKWDDIIPRLSTDLRQKRMAVLQLERSVQNLYDRVAALSCERPFDILFIQGLESSLYAYEDIKRLAGWDSEAVYTYDWRGVPPILDHLNQHRERFKTDFKCCFVFVLPAFAITYFIQRAPDFFDWRSGLFKFLSDKTLIAQEIKKLYGKSRHTSSFDENSLESVCVLPAEERTRDLLRVESLLRDADKVDLPHDQKAMLLYKQAHLLLCEEKYEMALASYKEVIQIQRNEESQIQQNKVCAFYFQGFALSGLERYAEAVESFREFLKVEPGKAQAWDLLGRAQRHLKQYEDAVASFDQSLAIEPQNNEAWCFRGRALRKLNRFQEAVTSFDRALDIEANDSDTWDLRGRALCELGQYEAAMESLQKSLELQPDTPWVRYFLGLSLSNLGRYEAAIQQLNSAIAMEPENYIFLALQGYVLSQLKRYQEARNSFDKALKHGYRKNGSDQEVFLLLPYICVHRGFALWKLGDYQLAIGSIWQAFLTFHQFPWLDKLKIIRNWLRKRVKAIPTPRMF